MLRTLKRTGVPVLWGTLLDRLDGDDRVRTATAASCRFDVDLIALNMGFQPEVNLARALGVPHRCARLDTVSPDGSQALPDAGRTGLPAAKQPAPMLGAFQHTLETLPRTERLRPKA